MTGGKIKRADGASIVEAANLLKKGQIIVFPTETVYGMAADATNDGAIEKIYHLKRRSAKQPLQILVDNLENARKLVNFSSNAEILAREFWPGPLTIILPAKRNTPISQLVGAGTNTLGIRIPAHDIALKLIRIFGKPMASTSANFSGMESSVNAIEAAGSMGALVPFVLDGGAATLGIASTVINMTGQEIKFLREGALSKEEILEKITGSSSQLSSASSK